MKVAKYGLGALAVVSLASLLPMLGDGVAGCSGYGPLAIARLNDCPDARTLLGDDIEFGSVGIACGSTSTENGYGHAGWRMPVVGSKGRGRYEFNAELHGGLWGMTRAVLYAEGETVNLMTCSDGAAAFDDAPQRLAQSCDNGDAAACLSLGAMYQQGALVPADPERATEYYNKACAAGANSACTGPAEKEDIE